MTSGGKIQKVGPQYHCSIHTNNNNVKPGLKKTLLHNMCKSVTKMTVESIKDGNFRVVALVIVLLFFAYVVALSCIAIGVVTKSPAEGLFKSKCFAEKNTIQIDVVMPSCGSSPKDRIWVNGVIRHGNTKHLMVNQNIKMDTLISLMVLPNNSMSDREVEIYKNETTIVAKRKVITGNEIQDGLFLMFREFSCYYDSRDDSVIMDDIGFDGVNLKRDIFVTITLVFTITCLMCLVPITLIIISCESIKLDISEKPGIFLRLIVFIVILLLPSQTKENEFSIEKSSKKDRKVGDDNNKTTNGDTDDKSNILGGEMLPEITESDDSKKDQ